MKRTLVLLLAFMLLLGACAEEQDGERIIRLKTDPPTYLQYNETTDYWDLYDETGKIDSNYYINEFGEEGAPHVVLHGNAYGYLSADGRWVFEPQFNLANSFREGFASVRKEENGPWGYITKDGGWLVQPVFDSAFWFSEGLACVGTGGLYGFIGTDGQYAIEPRFVETDWSFFDEGVCAVTEDGEKWGYIDRQGHWVIQPEYVNYMAINEGLIAVMDDGWKWRIADKNGNFVTEKKFANLHLFSEGLAAASEDGEHWGFIDTRGQWAIEPKYTAFYSDGFVNGNGLALVSLTPYDETVYYSRYNVLIDKEGRELLKAETITFKEDGSIEAYTDEGLREFRITEDGLDEIEIVKNDMYLKDYYPFEGSRVAVLDYEADFAFDWEHPIPRLDGATALLPVYAALAQAVYPKDLRYENYVDNANAFFTCTKTNRAYDRLVDGEADIIFCAGPSDQQIKEAKARGVEFEYTLFGYESFVFIVNPENPLDDITVDQIKAIYSGEITAWDELGAEGLGEIIAYQRPKNSGSQTALEKLMGDTPIMQAPQEYVSDGMEDILETIEYRNLPNAIGYTFRFFCADMVGSKVKLLAIDGAEPTVENISSGRYPIITPLYAVTRKGESNPNVKRLLDFLTDPQGQELVEKSGYVGLGN